MLKYIIPVLIMFSFVMDASAAVKVKNDTAAKYEAEMEAELNEAGAISTLENDIALLDAEIKKCQNSKKGWIAATVIGSAGVVSTGIAAGVQASKIQEQKSEISDKKSELKDLKAYSSDLDRKQE